jgi:hypothetical protein
MGDIQITFKVELGQQTLVALERMLRQKPATKQPTPQRDPQANTLARRSSQENAKRSRKLSTRGRLSKAWETSPRQNWTRHQFNEWIMDLFGPEERPAALLEMLKAWGRAKMHGKTIQRIPLRQAILKQSTNTLNVNRLAQLTGVAKGTVRSVLEEVTTDA